MRHLSALILCLTLAMPATAQDYQPPLADEPAPQDGLESGIENFMRNLLEQAQPHLEELGRDLGDTFGSVAPVLEDIGKLMDDVRNYHAPERLENGDILIRRRTDAPPPPPLGDNLRDMLRPAPDSGPDAQRPLPPRDPAAEIEL